MIGSAPEAPPYVIKEAARLIREHGLPQSTALAIARGEACEADEIDRKEISSAANRWRKTPPNEWPPVNPIWNTDEKFYHYSLDGVSAKEFNELYPEIDVIKIVTNDILSNLHFGSTRDDPLGEQYIDKSANIYEYWRRGLPTSPPFIEVYKGAEILIIGGTHRFYLAHYMVCAEIPFLVSRNDSAQLNAIISGCSSAPPPAE